MGIPKPQASRTGVKLDMLVKLFQNIVQRLEKLEGAYTGKYLEEKIEEAVDKKVTEVLEEAKEKEQRKHNIIIANFPESMGVTVEEKRQDDKDMVRNLVKKITDVPGDDLTDPIRLGPVQIGHNVGPRLLRMVVRTDESKADIMRNVYRLNEGVEFAERVYINNNSTPRERMKYRELKAEVARREAEGEADLIIRNLQIVKRRQRNAQN